MRQIVLAAAAILGQAGVAAAESLSASNSDLLGNRITDAEYGIVVVYGGNCLYGNRVAGETVLDLWDFQNNGTSEYGQNTFRTTQFGD